MSLKGLASRTDNNFQDKEAIGPHHDGGKSTLSESVAINAGIKHFLDFYDRISFLAGENEGMNKAHGLLLESMYPRNYLEILADLRRVTDHSELIRITKALDHFNQARGMIAEYATYGGMTETDALLELYNDSLNGENDFLNVLKTARHEAMDCIASMMWKLGEHSASKTEYEKYIEVENGLTLPNSFARKLEDPENKSLVISLDFNSTFNLSESYPTVDLVAKVQRMMHSFVRAFRKKYPNKELVVAINTGRPGLYAWGVAEAAFAPFKEARKVAVAESGGVILEDGLKSGKIKVHNGLPAEWGAVLEDIKNAILDEIEDKSAVQIEPKLSMLSMKIAEKGKFTLESREGEEVNPDWIRERVRQAVFNGPEGIRIEAKYNPTAGYVDIGSPDQNKFATLMKHVCEKNRLKPANVLFLQIGDSTTDIIPTENTATGGYNEGANDAYLVAINDSNPTLRKATEARGDKGVVTSNRSILAVEALFKGLKKLVR